MTLEAPDVGAALGDGKLLRLRGDPPLRGTAAVKQDVFDHEVLLTAAVNQVGHVTRCSADGADDNRVCITKEFISGDVHGNISVSKQKHLCQDWDDGLEQVVTIIQG